MKDNQGENEYKIFVKKGPIEGRGPVVPKFSFIWLNKENLALQK